MIHVLISSGAYVNSEFASELGDLPPTFVPIANRSFFEYQVDAIRQAIPDCKVSVSIPSSFCTQTFHLDRLMARAVTAIFVPDGISLRESALFSLTEILRLNDTDQLILLHGDTLTDIELTNTDVVSIAPSPEQYRWEEDSGTEGALHGLESGTALVWTGFFTFTKPEQLLEHLRNPEFSFVDAVRAYDRTNPMLRHLAKLWIDVGHINTYFRARSLITSERAFNRIQILDGLVRKTGTPRKKIRAEANWFRLMPRELRRYLPQFCGEESKNDSDCYFIEFLPITPLNELYVYGLKDQNFWRNILREVDHWFDDSVLASKRLDVYVENSTVTANEIWGAKTRERLFEFSSDTDFCLRTPIVLNDVVLPSISDIADACISKMLAMPYPTGIAHGDLCFSNILFDTRSASLKLIDPRGLNFVGEPTIFGGFLYDISKLGHSIVGLYDLILAGSYHIEVHGSNRFNFAVNTPTHVNATVESFLSHEFQPFALTGSQILPGVVLLFFSMLPLHSDDPLKQLALLINGCRVYAEYISKEST